VLIDTPVGEYFERFTTETINVQASKDHSVEEVYRQLSEVSPQMLRTNMQKLWLEDLYESCLLLNPTSREILSDLVKFEADCMTI